MNQSPFRLAPLSLLLLAAMLASCSQPTTPNNHPERTERYTAYFDEADTDKSGVLEQTEIDAAVAAMFSTMDYDKNSSITIEDIYNPEQGEPEGAIRNTDLAHHLPYDANADGAITPDEHRAFMDTNTFSKIDTNSDGQITLDEYRTYAQF